MPSANIRLYCLGFINREFLHRSNGEQQGVAMNAVLAALEGLTKEVAKVRVRTTQLGDRNHTSDVRLTYVEDQVTRIKNKMKQLKVRARSNTLSATS